MSLRVYNLKPSERDAVRSALTPHIPTRAVTFDLEQLIRLNDKRREIGEALINTLPEDVADSLINFSELDHLIIRDLPVSDDLPPTPRSISESTYPTIALPILFGVAALIKQPIDLQKRVENSIRFDDVDTGMNEEPWHCHLQHATSLFYCQRGDENARTYVARAQDILESAPSGLATSFIKAAAHIKGADSFALIHTHGETNTFSRCLFTTINLKGAYIPDLNMQGFHTRKSAITPSSQAYKDLKNAIKGTDDFFVYQPGDLALYQENATLRSSPAYEATNLGDEGRWIQTISTKPSHSLS